MSKKLEDSGCDSPDKTWKLFMFQYGFMRESINQPGVQCLHGGGGNKKNKNVLFAKCDVLISPTAQRSAGSVGD